MDLKFSYRHEDAIAQKELNDTDLFLFDLGMMHYFKVGTNEDLKRIQNKYTQKGIYIYTNNKQVIIIGKNQHLFENFERFDILEDNLITFGVHPDCIIIE